MTSLEILGLVEGASSQEIELKWRELRSQLHPDRGGDADEFHQAQQAYTEAHADATARESRCPTCGGDGTVEVTRGFNRISLACPTCR